MFQSAAELVNSRDWQGRSLACATSCLVDRASTQVGLITISETTTERSLGSLIHHWAEAVPAMIIVSAWLGRLVLPSNLASS